MAKKKQETTPARSVEEKERLMTIDAMNLAHERILDGTATSQLLTTVIKYGDKKRDLEIRKLEAEVKLAEAKTEAIKAAAGQEELYKSVLEAFKRCSPSEHSEEDEWS